ncbi:acetyl esterase/lipase [Roseimicrobium gellanilyticum]|uniref:Acetyl esterase/lipase n=1 Tax=Roseimicrobium gellanilyticum TaxID=748857 RepID=A0A366H2A5_9BACT|nr:alpha/beta hydrolase [Roseimicrobium gellanilyticum]RBP35681.1 acetyl esterase/lipase [Roseimicrobium gellanilyticum]
MLRTTFLTFVIVAFTAGFVVAQNPKPPAKKPAAAKREPLPSTPPDTIQAELDITYGKTPEQELKLDIYRPKAGGDKLPACLLVHGGGWVKGDKERFRPLAISLAEKGYVVANIEYRLGPVAKYPAAVQDCNLAVRFVRANASRFGIDPNRIGAWGGSAGGHLVGMMAAAPTHEKYLTGDLRDVSAAVQASCVMAGPTDLTMEKFVEALRRAKEKSYAFQWLGKLYDDAPELYREASPITHFSKSTGPVLFLTGDLDNPERDAPGMAKLKELGVPTKQVILKDARHGCWMQKPWHAQCVDAVDAWFKEHLK